MSDSSEQGQQQQTIKRLGVVTIHDACPAFSVKIFKSADELERLNIKYNIALVPFFNEKQDLPRFPEFVDKIKSYKTCELALHGLYHERKNGRFDDFHTITKAAHNTCKKIKVSKVLNWGFYWLSRKKCYKHC